MRSYGNPTRQREQLVVFASKFVGADRDFKGYHSQVGYREQAG